jgi:putative heme-binding domain-containing protein
MQHKVVTRILWNVSEIFRAVSRVPRATLLLFCLDLFAGAPFVGAPEPAKPPKDSPLAAEEQLATFAVPPGFKVELVAAEPDGGKFIAICFDHAGRMWTMTALEYPLDANEAGPDARALFARGGRDGVLVFDTPTVPGRQKARTFADGLVMPLGLLPYKDGAYVQYGGEIRFYRDAEGNGKADGFTPVLSGFGIEDSHLFPHQFTRAPGGWLWLAQGAFNYSKVKATTGNVTDFNKTKLARFTPDGKRFEIIGWGPCNIWGLVIDRLGEVFIQEANDQGWPLMPFLEGASYPLCGDDVPRPYAPPFPKLGEREMGGTGLSGLALSEGGDSFPGEYRDVFYIANPITGMIQAIRLHRGVSSSRREEAQTSLQKSQSLVTSAATKGDHSNGWRLEHLPDFIRCGDPWFRPVAIQFGPDGCLYIVDWYNKVISHNEVPRNHPERDKTRGRIWRVRHESQPARINVPNLYKASGKELLVHLRAANTWEVNAAWQEIVDRRDVSLAPQLAKIVMDDRQPNDLRIRALWSLEGLGKVEMKHLEKFAAAKHRALRKEALRVARANASHLRHGPKFVAMAEQGLADPDRLVRQEAIRLLGEMVSDSEVTRPVPQHGIVGLLINAAVRMPDARHDKWPEYFAAFERYLIRMNLEGERSALAAWFAANNDGLNGDQPARHAFAALALGGAEGARKLAQFLPGDPTSEELLLIASAPNDPAAGRVLNSSLANPGNLRFLYENRSRLADHTALAPLLTDALRSLVKNDPSDANLELLLKLASGFRLSSLEEDVARIAQRAAGKTPAALALAAVRTLRELKSPRVDLFKAFAASANAELQREAVLALAAAKSDAAVPALLELWPSLNSALRRVTVDRLASSAAGARQLVAAVGSGAISRDELDGYTLDKLSAVLPDDAAVKQLVAELGNSLKPVLRLSGGDGDYVDTDLTLRGPFTVECWVKFDPGIGNQDSILAGPGALDANFYDNRFRVWVGGAINDIVIASKPVAPEAWTHVAFTRDEAGRFRLFLNGELDLASTGVEKRDFEHLKVGFSNGAGGTAGDFAEFRVWNVCRSPDEIRATANVAIQGGVSPAHSSATSTSAGGTAALLYHGADESWGKLHGNARIERTADLPPVETEAGAKAVEAKFVQFRSLANKAGNLARGQQVFAATCGVCHTVKGQGGKIGPVLDGAGANGVEALLRNILTPNAAMEAGYRRFRVETRDGDVLDGMFISQDGDGLVLRQPNAEDLRIPRGNVKRAVFTRLSVMPEGLLEGLKAEDVSDLFAYLKTLR